MQSFSVPAHLDFACPQQENFDLRTQSSPIPKLFCQVQVLELSLRLNFRTDVWISVPSSTFPWDQRFSRSICDLIPRFLTTAVILSPKNPPSFWHFQITRWRVFSWVLLSLSPFLSASLFLFLFLWHSLSLSTFLSISPSIVPPSKPNSFSCWSPPPQKEFPLASYPSFYLALSWTHKWLLSYQTCLGKVWFDLLS